jgi:hypothetical protein
VKDQVGNRFFTISTISFTACLEPRLSSRARLQSIANRDGRTAAHRLWLGRGAAVLCGAQSCSAYSDQVISVIRNVQAARRSQVFKASKGPLIRLLIVAQKASGNSAGMARNSTARCQMRSSILSESSASQNDVCVSLRHAVCFGSHSFSMLVSISESE